MMNLSDYLRNKYYKGDEKIIFLHRQIDINVADVEVFNYKLPKETSLLIEGVAIATDLFSAPMPPADITLFTTKLTFGNDIIFPFNVEEYNYQDTFFGVWIDSYFRNPVFFPIFKEIEGNGELKFIVGNTSGSSVRCFPFLKARLKYK